MTDYQKNKLDEILYHEYYIELGEQCINSLDTLSNTSIFNNNEQMYKLIEELEKYKDSECVDYVMSELYYIYKTTRIYIVYGDLVNYSYQYTLSSESLSIMRPQLFVLEEYNHPLIRVLMEQENCFVGYNDKIVRDMIESQFDENDYEDNEDFYKGLVKNLFYCKSKYQKSIGSYLELFLFDCKRFIKLFLQTELKSNKLIEINKSLEEILKESLLKDYGDILDRLKVMINLKGLNEKDFKKEFQVEEFYELKKYFKLYSLINDEMDLMKKYHILETYGWGINNINPSPELQLYALKSNPCCFTEMKNPSDKVIDYINNNYEIQNEIVNHFGGNIRYIKNPSPELQLKTIQYDKDNIVYLEHLPPHESVIEWIKKWDMINENYESKLKSVQEDGMNIKYLIQCGEFDYELDCKIMIEAIKQNPNVLKYHISIYGEDDEGYDWTPVNNFIREDRELTKKMIKINPYFLTQINNPDEELQMMLLDISRENNDFWVEVFLQMDKNLLIPEVLEYLED